MMNPGSLKVTARNDCEIVMTRTFDAPRRLVFDAFTKPELVMRWLTGPPGWSMPICEIDLRIGGAYRYQWTGPGGSVMGVRGMYREVTAPERIVHTEIFDEPWYPGELVITSVFPEKDGKTFFASTLVYASREARDGVLKTPMESGVRASYDNLANLLASGALS